MSSDAETAKNHGSLPAPPAPAGAYEPVVVYDRMGFVSAQFPFSEGTLRYVGRVGLELSEAEGRAAARLAALNVLAHISASLGGLGRIARLLRVDGYVASAPGFTGQPGVLDGASETFLEFLGERGQHTRSAISVPELPLGAAVEIVVTFAVSAPPVLSPP